MIIDFGPHLDGMQPFAPSTALGAVALGPARLLDLLEQRLGLPPVLARPGEALLRYQSCLIEADNGRRFYHRSLATDPLGVARTLLAWRADWHEAGWTGDFPPGASARLADMAAVERLTRERVPLTSGQRLERVESALAEGLDPRVDRIVLHENLDALPPRWRRVLARLALELVPGVAGPAIRNPSSNARPSREPPSLRNEAPGETGNLFAPAELAGATGTERQPRPGAGTASDLERIQCTLASLGDEAAGSARHRESLAGDGSVIVLRGISRDLTAQAIGELLLQRRDRIGEAVVIAERDGIILDNAFERVGLPRAGFQHYSRFRAVAQVLKLCLGLVWEPVSPHLLLQFLIHPVGPLPDHVRSTLAEAVAQEPGIGGTAWREALKTIAERMRTRFERSEKETAALLAEIAYWLDCERFRADAGAPLTVLIERAQRCTTWLAKRLHTLSDPREATLFAGAEAQGEALIAALAELRERDGAHIGRIALERIVDEVGGRAADPGTFAEAGHVRATTEPGAITAAWPTVIWWDLHAQPPAPRYPWSDAELAELAAAGVALPAAATRVRQRMQEWQRPVMNARDRLVLVIHDRDEGRHPLWSRLSGLFEGFTEVRVEEALLAGSGRDPQPEPTASVGAGTGSSSAGHTIPALDVPTAPLPLKHLPRPRRWWTLPDGVAIPPRATESYSSIAKLIDHPHEWVLNYAARLRTGRAEDLPSGGLLYGRLAHRLIERFFTTHPNWATLEQSTIDAWRADYLPRLVAEEGALLCEPGSGVRREDVTATLERAFASLLAHLKRAHIVTAMAEQPLEVPFGDVTLTGAIDLSLRDARGRAIVLDVKWSGEGYRGDELAAGRCLQLATYAYMQRTADRLDAWPYHAYFIVTTGNVLAPDANVFPDAIVVPPADGEGIAEVWARAARTYAWRRAQIAAGRIEVTAEGTEPTVESEPPADGLATAVGEDRFDDFTRLTGWDEGA